MTEKPAKVLIIGAGAKINGQAAEFDYAGTQACQAMRQTGPVLAGDDRGKEAI